MFARHGIQNALRTPRRSVVFLLLMTLLVALLGTSLGLSYALEETLKQCRENYSTIGLVEYIGPGYPSSNTVVEETADILAAFEAALDREDPTLINWEPTRMALGYTPQMELLTNLKLLSGQYVAVVKVQCQTEYDGMYYQRLSNHTHLEYLEYYVNHRKLPLYNCLVTELLFNYSTQLMVGTPALLEIPGVADTSFPAQSYVDNSGLLIPGHYYLVHGRVGDTSLLGPAYLQLTPIEYELSDKKIKGSDLLDITLPDGSCAALDGSSLPEAMAETYQVAAHSLTVQASNRPDDLLPFQQGELTLTKGAFYAADSKGCLVSEIVNFSTYFRKTAARSTSPCCCL